MAIVIGGSERKTEDLNDEIKKILYRFEEEELVIERTYELLLVALIVTKS